MSTSKTTQRSAPASGQRGKTPVAELPDLELLAATELRMSEKQGRRLGQLLEQQQNGTLNEAARNQLAALTQVYHECLVRKAQALHEAVRRCLHKPLTP